MCGITGIFDTRGKRDIDRAVLHRMNESQFHRGPDAGGLHIEPGVGLGHRRLSIIDLSTGQQPLYNEDSSICVVFNGEIYNYRELIPELQALGHVFHTRSDTEVIVHAWEAWGDRSVERFRGMFAFALWDRNQSVLFLARDRLGVKPLFYAQLDDGIFLFGSELKSILAHGGLRHDIDPYAVEEYFALGYIAEPRSIYRQARKLPPGHTLKVGAGGTALAEPREYWDVHFTLDNRLTLIEAERQLVERIDEAVKVRLVAEVPLGAFLSGGVDSSVVVASMARMSADPVCTCAIGFTDPHFNESEFAAQVAQRYQTRHHLDIVDSDDFSLVDKLGHSYDEPYADSSAIPTYRVCELARRHVTVALSGDGGDESFGGYRRYALHLMENRWRQSLPSIIRKPVFGLLGRYYPKADWAPRFLRAKTTFQALAIDPLEAYMHSVSLLREDHRQQLYSPAFKKMLGGYTAMEVFRNHGRKANLDDPLARIQYLDMKTMLVGDFNTKVDRASMAHSLEVREPLMDHHLVEWMATLPSDVKMRGHQGKWLLKKAFEPYLPHAVLYRPKMGFSVPLARWLRGPLKHRMQASILGERMASSGYFDPAYLRHLVDSHLSGQRDFSSALWCLLMFDVFLQRSGAG